jgi:cbb3-type cytochrome oxidase subunit 3
MISFPFAEHFTIVQQAVAHIFTIVMAGVFKVGYVAFIVGKYERKLPF